MPLTGHLQNLTPYSGYYPLSKAIAREHVIVNSILTNKDIVNGCGPRLMYPPLLALCNSLCYMTGMETLN
jgi:hypothetical protein